MARFQKYISLPEIVIASAGVPQRVSTSQIIAKSCILQAKNTNTGVVTVGDQITQVLQLVSTNPSVSIAGDGMDLGGAGVLDLSEIWVASTVTGDRVIVQYLDGF